MAVVTVAALTPLNTTWTLASGLRQILDLNGRAVRVELAPQSRFANDPEFNTGLAGAWVTLSGGNAFSLDANGTLPDNLVIITNASTAWFGGSTTGPYVYQVLSGDFDVYARVACGPGITSGPGQYSLAGLVAQQDSTPANWTGIFAANYTLGWRATNSASGLTDIVGAMPSALLGGYAWVRLRRVGSTFTQFYSTDGYTWTTMAAPAGDPTFSTLCRVGFTGWSSASAHQWACDFIRNWPPYVTGGPVATFQLDSGNAGTIWALSTFLSQVNPYWQYSPEVAVVGGGFQYQYGAADTAPPALNGTWLNELSMRSEPDAAGQFFKLAVQFNTSDGRQYAAWCNAQITATYAGGGGGVGGGAIVLA